MEASMKIVNVKAIAPLFVCVALVLAGCGDDDPGPVDAATGAAQVAELGLAAQESSDETLDALLEPLGGAVPLGVAALNPDPCPALTIDASTEPVRSVTVTVEFGTTPETTTPWPPDAADPCLRNGEREGQVYLFGSLVASMTGTRTELERSETLNDLGARKTRNDFVDWHEWRRDGSRSFSRNGFALQASEELVTSRTHVEGDDQTGGTVSTNLEWSFTPLAGSELEAERPRPSGTIEVDGSWAFEGQLLVDTDDDESTPKELVDVNVTHTVATVTPLEYDATCTEFRPRRRIKAGQLLFTRQRGDAAVSFTLTWSACGEEPVKAEVS
jgi:hypothetical protein